MSNVNIFAGGTLDRAALRRKDEPWLRDRLAAADTRILPFCQGRHAVTGPRQAPVPATLSAADPWWRDLAADTVVLLGVDGDGAAWFALDLSATVADPKEDARTAALGAWVDLRSLGPVLDQGTGSLFATMRGLYEWHARHRHCGVCGHHTRVEEAGHMRRCTNPACATPHFPRHDPAVIMLIHDGDRCVLGRQARFPPGFHSVLAGFVEHGESLEDAVARECQEEAGITVTDVRYHSSQPWPFPSSLMLAFHARATRFDLVNDPEELESVGWYDRAFVAERLAAQAAGAIQPGEFSPPSPISVAGRLLRDWVAGHLP